MSKEEKEDCVGLAIKVGYASSRARALPCKI